MSSCALQFETGRKQSMVDFPRFLFRILLILPETGLNVFGTMWAFCGTIECKSEDKISQTVIEGKSMMGICFLLVALDGFQAQGGKVLLIDVGLNFAC